MGLFQKKDKYTAAICPDCGGKLTVDSLHDTASCAYCGTQFVIDRSGGRKKGALEVVFNFVERQQDRRAKAKEEERKREEEERRKKIEHLKKYGWLYALGVVLFFGFLVFMATLG